MEKDGARSILGGIGGNSKGCSKVGEVEDWLRQEQGLEGIEGGLTSGGPVPRQVFLGEVNERSGDIGVVRNKASVEVGEAEERSDVFDFLGGGPACNTIQFDRIHGKLSRFHNHSEVFHFGGSEATFLQFEMEV